MLLTIAYLLENTNGKHLNSWLVDFSIEKLRNQLLWWRVSNWKATRWAERHQCQVQNLLLTHKYHKLVSEEDWDPFWAELYPLFIPVVIVFVCDAFVCVTIWAHVGLCSPRNSCELSFEWGRGVPLCVRARTRVCVCVSEREPGGGDGNELPHMHYKKSQP